MPLSAAERGPMVAKPGFSYQDGYKFGEDYDTSQYPAEKWEELIKYGRQLAIITGHEFFNGVADRIKRLMEKEKAAHKSG